MGLTGQVAAGNGATAEAGAAALRAGGNAVDAAVAATFAAFVAEPLLTGPYGGGFAVGCGAGTPWCYDFFADVPARGGGDFVGVEVDFGATRQRFFIGRGATAVSALLPGLVRLQAERGRLSIGTVLAPAVALAERGVTLTGGVAAFLPVLEPILRHSPAVAALFAPGGRLLAAGDAFRNPVLGAFLARLAAGDPVDFGPRLAEFPVDGCAPVFEREPLCLKVGDATVVLNPAPASGGLLIAFALRLLEDFDGWNDPVASALALLRAIDLTNRARAGGLDAALIGRGDPGQVASFLDDTHLAQWRSERFGGSSAALPTHGSTTHVSAIDADGGACAITSSNGEGCGYLIPGVGAMANNFLGEEDLHPLGLHIQAPGTRLSSMMCPTLVLMQGRPLLALGSGGSNRIRTAILQVLAGTLLCGRDVAGAVHAPRMHYEGGALYVEAEGQPAGVLDALRRAVPHAILFRPHNIFFGGVHTAGVHGSVGDPRRGGVVAQGTGAA
jgi:gamma-glutamyltranspeptidase/glutathione hydrolase